MMWSTRGFLVLYFLLLVDYRLSHAQKESLNFCDISCVNNIYKFYCGEARCTTGASDYGQIFQLCGSPCVAAVAGEVMMQCLTVTVPDRADWEEVQSSVVQEIVEFCAGYDITVDTTLPPLSLKDTDKALLDTLYDDPEGEKKKKKGESKKGKGSNKKTSAAKESKNEKTDKEKDKGNTKKTKPSKKRPMKRPEKQPKNTPKAPSIKPESTSTPPITHPTIQIHPIEPKNTRTESKKEPSPADVASDQEPIEEEGETVVLDSDDQAMGSMTAEEAGSEIEESLEAF